MKESMNDHIFSKEYEVRYDDVDRNHELKAVSVLNYLEDTALAHSAYLGYTLKRFLEEKNVWILTSLAMEMKRYPSYGESFTVETWAVDFGRFRATRNFRLKDSEGQLLGNLSSQWIFFDLTLRRPAKTTEEMKQDFGTNQTCTLTTDSKKLSFDGMISYGDPMEIRHSDIDAMDHVNNKRYVEWMIEALPEDMQKQKVSRMEIAYLKEAHYGSSILSGFAPIENNEGEAGFFHKIMSLDGQTEHAFGKMYFDRF